MRIQRWQAAISSIHWLIFMMIKFKSMRHIQNSACKMLLQANSQRAIITSHRTTLSRWTIIHNDYRRYMLASDRWQCHSPLLLCRAYAVSSVKTPKCRQFVRFYVHNRLHGDSSLNESLLHTIPRLNRDTCLCSMHSYTEFERFLIGLDTNELS